MIKWLKAAECKKGLFIVLLQQQRSGGGTAAAETASPLRHRVTLRRVAARHRWARTAGMHGRPRDRCGVTGGDYAPTLVTGRRGAQPSPSRTVHQLLGPKQAGKAQHATEGIQV